MIIRTYADYLLAVTGCCDCIIPGCAEPRKECKGIGAYVDLAWEIAVNNPDTNIYEYFTHRRVDYGGGGYQDWSLDQGWNVYLDGYSTNPAASIDAAEIDLAVETYNEAGPYTGGTTSTYDGLINIVEAQSKGVGITIPWDDEDLQPFFSDEACNSSAEYFDAAIPSLDRVFQGVYARYRMGVPEGYSTSVYEIQWDEVFVPKEWDEWNWEYQAYLLTLASYKIDKAIWDECMLENDNDTGICGDEPVEPEFSLPEPENGPSLITSREFIYDGENEFSPWYDLPVPEENGQVRVVNVMVKCYHYTDHGVKPCAFGEVINLD